MNSIPWDIFPYFNIYDLCKISRTSLMFFRYWKFRYTFVMFCHILSGGNPCTIIILPQVI